MQKQTSLVLFALCGSDLNLPQERVTRTSPNKDKSALMNNAGTHAAYGALLAYERTQKQEGSWLSS